MEFTLRLPYPPSNNHYKKLGAERFNSRTGKLSRSFYLSPETDRYHREVAFRFRVQKGVQLKSKNIRMQIDVYPPDKRRRDLDNVCKVVLDSLQKCEAYEDDFYIQELIVVRREIAIAGELVVHLKELDHA